MMIQQAFIINGIYTTQPHTLTHTHTHVFIIAKLL